MAALKESVRDWVQEFVSTHEQSGEYMAADVLRLIQEESNLLYETQCIQDLFDQDPFQCFNDSPMLLQLIQKFKAGLRVESCHRLERGDDYCFVEAAVRIGCPSASNSSSNSSEKEGTQKLSPLAKKQKRQRTSSVEQNDNGNDNDNQHPILLHFRYERDPATETAATSIWYSIDLSKQYGPKENILTMRVWADGNKPSKLPAVSVEKMGGHGDSDDDWEDIDTDEEENNNDSDDIGKDIGKTHNHVKELARNIKDTSIDESKTKTSATGDKENEKDDNKSSAKGNEGEADRYACFVDPVVLQSFQESAELTGMDEAAAFFTLMTFPFYQHEFDLVGFVLDSVFADDDNEDGDDDEDLVEDE